MTVYEANYIKGQCDREKILTCSPPCTLQNAHAFRGYMDGYGGNSFKEPVKVGLIIDDLIRKGMTTVKGE
ncbi:hypothetical protein HN682_09665 [Candidatus Peregrinibacteria bacterium]|jgi:hypothetical protein|nr:hypothetical protein [Candidatus Peregrinibacteria bacterium]